MPSVLWMLSDDPLMPRSGRSRSMGVDDMAEVEEEEEEEKATTVMAATRMARDCLRQGE